MPVKTGHRRGARAVVEVEHTEEFRRGLADGFAVVHFEHRVLLQGHGDDAAHAAADKAGFLGGAARHFLFDGHLSAARLRHALDHRVGIVGHLGSQVHSAPCASQPKVQAAVILAQEQQPALRVRQLQRGVHQRGQDLVERRRAVQDLSHLEQQSQVLDLLGGPRGALRGLLKFLEQARQHGILSHERDLVGVDHSQADLVAGFEVALRPAFAAKDAWAIQLARPAGDFAARILHVEIQLAMRIAPHEFRHGAV